MTFVIHPTLKKLSNLDTYVMNYGNKIFGKKWRIAIIHSLQHGPKRFSQIKANLPGCSVKVLSESLQEMEENNILTRRQYQTIPVKVTYELSKHVVEFLHVLEGYRTLVVCHLYINRKRYEIPREVLEEIESIMEDKDIDVSSLLDGK